MLSPLAPDVGCGNRRNWRCDVTRAAAVETVEDRLSDAGYRSRCRHGALRVFRHDEDHEIAWVLTTGRIQIRLATSVARSQRRRVAQALYGNLEAAFFDAAAHPDEESPHA